MFLKSPLPPTTTTTTTTTMSLPPLSPNSLVPRTSVGESLSPSTSTSTSTSPSPSPSMSMSMSTSTPTPTPTQRTENKNKKKRSRKIRRRPTKVTLRAVCSIFRWSLSVSRPSPCRFPSLSLPRAARIPSSAASRTTTGTLFGHRKGRITLAIQDTPQSPSPSLLLELAVPTGKFMQEMAANHLRVALECDKKNLPDISGGAEGPSRLLDEPLWTAYVNGRKVGYAVRRDPTDDDLAVARLLRTVSAGAGVLPADVVGDCREGEGDLAYMRAHFDRVVGGKDSESFYMLNPDGNNGPELSIFFIRI